MYNFSASNRNALTASLTYSDLAQCTGAATVLQLIKGVCCVSELGVVHFLGLGWADALLVCQPNCDACD